MSYIDCTLTINDADEWHQYPLNVAFDEEGQVANSEIRTVPVKVHLGSIANLENNRVMGSELQLTTQSFTHMDAPRHFDKGGTPVDKLPLDKLIGDAVVFDMSHKEPGGTVTASDLEKSDVDIREGDIAIIRTDWTDRAWKTERFWSDMIHQSEDAAEWLIKQGIAGLAQDFFPDVKPIERSEEGELIDSGRGRPNHVKYLVENDIPLFEWCTNFGEISRRRVKFLGLPLKIEGADGSPIRAVVIED